MTIASNKTTRTNKRLKIATLQDLKDVVMFLSPYHVRSLKIDGVEIDFDTDAFRADTPETIDDDAEKVTKVRRGLEDLLDDAKQDELWSV
jgi:aminopeptidase N